MARVHHRHRARVLADWGFKCGVCNKTGNLEIHHIKPQKENGTSEEDNLIPLCEGCHFVTLRTKSVIRFDLIIKQHKEKKS